MKFASKTKASDSRLRMSTESVTGSQKAASRPAVPWRAKPASGFILTRAKSFLFVILTQAERRGRILEWWRIAVVRSPATGSVPWPRFQPEVVGLELSRQF